jgi:hypothetical protein
MIWKSPRWILLCSFLTIVSVAALTFNGCHGGSANEPGKVQDEALRAGRDVNSFPAGSEDYFHDMDQNADANHQVHALDLTPNEIKGRNTWIVWTGGNDRLWDALSRLSVGNLDLLKTISSHAKLKGGRDNRWAWMGLMNEPCFEKASGPDPNRFGLWLDQRKTGPGCPPDPFEDESKYPGVRIGHRGQDLPDGKFIPQDHKMPVGSFYGYATGVVGLRLFPNPDFDEKAAKKWDPDRYYSDPSYYNDKDLVKPYRVGMSCGFCHVGPNPLKPPADPENPKWENLSSNVGAQYFWIDRIFTFENDHGSYAWQMFHTSRPGTIDTSLVSTDNINNPRTMNAVYQLLPRLALAKRSGEEKLSPGTCVGNEQPPCGDENNRQFNEFTQDPLFTQFFDKNSQTVWSPRVLKDGADSVGALGALNRVYINIGLFSEEWLLHFNALVGGKKVSPITIANARKNSVYWQSTELQTMNMALFFLKTTAPHYLRDAEGGDKYVPKDTAKLKQGKIVFAERCARCHSSKAPTPPEGMNPGACPGQGYLDCWNKYWAWTKTDEFKKQMRDIVLKDDFLKDNFMSIELRVPVTLLQTNACSPLATNALENNIWDNFSSRSYKDLPSVGTIKVQDPLTGEDKAYPMPGGGRGFTRPASLVSLWSSAPFLLNNTVGDLAPGAYSQYGTQDSYNPSPSVDNRMKSFNDSIEKMLWPEKRDKDSVLGNKIHGPSLIDRTTQRSSLKIAAGYVPDELRGLLGVGHRWFPSLFGEGGISIGPIPAGTPVNLLANLDMEKVRHDPDAIKLLIKLKHDLESLPANASDEEAGKALSNLVPDLMKYSKCPDFVVNRGHYFGTNFLPEEPALNDDEKRALIEFLKTF